MKLRTIILVLSLLAFLSTAVGGYLYYSALHESAIEAARREDLSRLAILRKNVSFFLSKNIRPVQVLAGLAPLLDKLTRPNDAAVQDAANATLDLCKRALEVEVCYLMDYEGNTVASSNRNAPDSFVGKNFAFRPYFQEAFHSAPATYLALGVTSGKRGAYFSYPVFESGEDIPVGLAVIKAPIENIEKEMALTPGEDILVADPHGVVFISSRRQWLFQALAPLSADQSDKLSRSRQFGTGPWPWTGLTFDADTAATDRSGAVYMRHQANIDNYSGWKIIHLRNLESISRSVADPFITIIGPIVGSLCFLIGLAVVILYRKARHEILRRRSVEKALRDSEERYRSLYHRTPAMLHSIDDEGRVVSVSDYWTEALGYPREEVIGKRLTDFFTEASRQHAKNVVFPEFFQTGICRDVPYRFVKKDGNEIDILLSAIAVRDEAGRIVRSLAVSIDVTQRKKFERALNKAKEQLSRHSKDLERQVRERTREISSILKYTPDVVYIKDTQGRYLLVNSCYEQILGMTGAEVRNKTDAQLLPPEIAAQFRRNDQCALERRAPYQVEEHLPQRDGLHTYLSVKFPIYDDGGQIIAVCGISTDITALKKAQNQLRRLSASIMDNQEKERAAIARELHDELGQVLTALHMDAVWMVERFKTGDPAAAQRALTMCDLIDKNINDVRGMAIRLRPGVLDDLGLVDALEWYTADFESRTGIVCVFEHSPVETIAGPVATAAYRITQEALTNTLRHARAGRIHVGMETRDGDLILTVSDDGVGFDPTELADSEGLGIAGMRERAVLVGGMLTIDTAPGRGMRVVLRVPLERLESAGS